MIDLEICPEYKRDKARMDIILKIVKELWCKFPELRFLQLMESITSNLKNEEQDPFYIEDEEFIDIVKRIKSEWRIKLNEQN